MIEEFRELLTPRGQDLVPGDLDPDGDELARIFLEPLTDGRGFSTEEAIQLISGRRWLLADSGYYSYSASGPDSEMACYLKSSAAHNTALVNGECQLLFALG